MNPLLKAGAALAIAVVAAVYFCAAHPKPANPPVDPSKIIAAAAQYAHDLKESGSPVPPTVPLKELIARKMLKPADVSGFEGAEVTVSLASLSANSTGPNDVLMRARMPDGVELELLEDGSVQQKPR